MGVHSKFAPSSAERWFTCPGSIQLNNQVLDLDTTSYALEGSEAHGYAEKLLKGCISIEDIPEDFQEYLLYYSNVIDKILNLMPNSKIFTEYKVSIPTTPIFGTCDCIIANTKKLYIIDYKHGVGHLVNSKDNKQLLTYAVGALYSLKEDLKFSKIKEITCVIVQPRSFSESKLNFHTYSRIELFTFERELRQKVDSIEDGENYLCEGKHCGFCNAKPICPEKNRQAIETIKSEIDTVQKKLPIPKSLTLDEMKKVLDNGDSIINWIRSVQGYAKSLLEHGRKIDGYKLVRKRSNRKWKDETKTFETLSCMCKPIDLIVEKMKSVAQVEKFIKDKELISELSYSPNAGLTIASETDNRIGISHSAFDDFRDI